MLMKIVLILYVSKFNFRVMFKLLLPETNDIVIKNYFVVFNVEFCWVSKSVVFQNQANAWAKIVRSSPGSWSLFFLHNWILWNKCLLSFDAVHLIYLRYCFALLMSLHSLLFWTDNNVSFQRQKNICKKFSFFNSKLSCFPCRFYCLC